MTLEVNELEAIWLGVNSTTLAVVTLNLWDAWLTRVEVKILNGAAREFVATLDVVKDALRLTVQLAFVAAVLPGIFAPGDAEFSPAVVLLLSGVVVTSITSLLDRYGRHRLLAFAKTKPTGDRLENIEDKLDENTELTKDAGRKAEAAYHEANSVNEKIEAQGRRVEAMQRHERDEDHGK